MAKLSPVLFYYEKGENIEFSNLYPSRIRISGRSYGSVEAYYQSRKAKTAELRKWIASARNGAEAKRRGESLKRDQIAKDWNLKRLAVMRKALFAKFTQNQRLRMRLLATGNAEMHEDSPDDMFWGIKGRDVMGKMLVRLRSALKSGKPRRFLDA